MNKRTVLALVLTAIVIVVTPRFFSHPAAPLADTTAVATKAGATSAAAAAKPVSPTASPSVSASTSASTAAAPAATGTTPAQPAVKPETTTVAHGGVRYSFTNLGARPLVVRLPDSVYHSLRPGERGQPVMLEQPQGALLGLGLVAGRDTIALDTVAFTPATTPNGVSFTTATPRPITIDYTFADQPYLMHVSGHVAGGPATVLVRLPSRLRSQEADTLDDLRHFAFGYKLAKEDVTSLPFSKIDTVARADTGAIQWVAMRSKYWLVAALTPGTTNFTALHMRGAPPENKIHREAAGVATLPAPTGAFQFDLYTGPQSFEGLRRIGHGLENVNPYSGFFRAIVQPFAVITMRVLLWMKHTTALSYGWVLIIFGVVIRVIMWPLYQSSMRSSIKMQRIQPELQAVQGKYKSDPEKQRAELMRVYQEHGMSPFSPMLGCLPMLLPMPILFALYSVFQNTIEFRGVPFWWMPDLALKDPYYITPIVMGVTMFAMSWIGMRNMPPNPQTRMMSYMMPAMMTVIFLNFPAGLNLYYAVQNITQIPQQWMLAHERAKAGVGRGPVRVVEQKPARGSQGKRRT